MASPTAEMSSADVLERAKREAVKFVNLQFTDVIGIVKSVTIPVDQLEDALEHGKWFDGSSIEGFARIAESDMYLEARPLHLRGDSLGAGREHDRARDLLGLHAEGRALPRRPALRAQARAGGSERAGLRVQHRPGAGVLPLQARRRRSHGASPARPRRLLRPFHRPRRPRAQGDGQRAQRLRHRRRDLPPRGGGRSARDRLQVRRGAEDGRQRRDPAATRSRRSPSVTACTRPSCPSRSSASRATACTSTRASRAWTAGERLLPTRTTSTVCRTVAKHFIAGQLHHARGMCAILAPLVNSYKRLVPGYEAPVYISWARVNRSALIRVPQVSPGQDAGDAHRAALSRSELQPVPGLRRDAEVRPGRHQAQAAAARAGGGEPLPLRRRRAEAAQRAACCPAAWARRSTRLERDEVVQEALGEHVYSASSTPSGRSGTSTACT